MIIHHYINQFDNDFGADLILAHIDPVTFMLSKKHCVEICKYLVQDCKHLLPADVKEEHQQIYDRLLAAEKLQPHLRIPISIDPFFQNSAHPLYYLYLLLMVHLKDNYYLGYFENAFVASIYLHNNNNLSKIKEYTAITHSSLSYLQKDNNQLSLRHPSFIDDIKEKIIYIQDEYNDDLIIEYDNKWYINICDRIDYIMNFGQNSFEELLEKIVNSDDPFWTYSRNWINNLYKKD